MEICVGDVTAGITGAAFPGVREVLSRLGISTGTIRRNSPAANVSALKSNEMIPKINIAFTPENPKPGDKVTAIAAASGFENDLSNLYYTWFLKRKECSLRPSNYNHRNRQDYRREDFLGDSVSSGNNRSQQDCDVDGDNLISVNDWKIMASEEIVRNDFTPDLSGKYSDNSDFYRIHNGNSGTEDWNESADDDGYQAWQGGADKERMNAHCYAYHPTSGKIYELLRNSLLAGAVPICPDNLPAECGITRSATLSAPDYDWCYCTDDGTHAVYGRGECTDFDPGGRASDCTEGSTPGWLVGSGECCITGDGLDFFHYHCQQYTGGGHHLGCEAAPDVEARCVPIGGSERLAAICGEDENRDGLEDDPGSGGTRTFQGRDGRMAALCPRSGGLAGSAYPPTPLSEHLTSDQFLDQVDDGFRWDNYFYRYETSQTTGTTMDNLPMCFCDRIQVYYSTPAGGDEEPYTGPSDAPLCDGDVLGESDLLCGSGGTGSKDQYHLFPWSVSIEGETHNYYQASREYVRGDGNQWVYDYRIREYDTGDGDFDADEEKFWLTDPRNPSTAGNGQYDESNLAGKGIGEFTWIYEEGDEVGVAVEGTSLLPTKYEDSSRMIFWAFSQGPEYGSKCLVQDRGPYNPQRSLTANRSISIETGFLDFDQCAAYSTVSPVAGGSLTGGQPSGLEVELSLSPKNPRNDESGAGQGDTVSAQAVTLGSSSGENSLEYEWTIKKIIPDPTEAENISRKPSERDWESAQVICGSNSSNCPFKTPEGRSLKTNGPGLNQLDFRLDLCNDGSGTACENDVNLSQYFNTNGDGYLQFTVRVRESGSETNATTLLSGQASGEMKITTSLESQLTVFRPTVSGGTLGAPGSQICDTSSVCQVAPNDIIGLMAPNAFSSSNRTGGTGQTLNNFQWTRNNVVLDCDSSISVNCADDAATRYMFFPVTDSPGTTFTVKVKASNISGAEANITGRSLEISRDFEVVSPEARIYPADLGCAAADLASEGTVRFKRVGTIPDPTGLANDQDDYSRSVLVAQSGGTATLQACYLPEYLNRSGQVADVSWQKDGTSIPSPSFTAGPDGTVHTVRMSGEYRQSQDIYRILREKFGVDKSKLDRQNLNATAQIESRSSLVGLNEQSSRFFAALIDRLPARALFLLRLIFTLLTIMSVAGAVFAFFPKLRYDNGKE